VVTAVLPGCRVPLPEGARCPTTNECYDALTVTGGLAHAAQLPCDGAHTWEVYAVGDLPSGVRSMNVAALRRTAPVADACNRQTFLLTTLRMDSGWRFDVLPPTPRAYAAGDRTFRCLAGRGPGALTAPTLSG
jgi:hypothetical protein